MKVFTSWTSFASSVFSVRVQLYVCLVLGNGKVKQWRPSTQSTSHKLSGSFVLAWSQASLSLELVISLKSKCWMRSYCKQTQLPGARPSDRGFSKGYSSFWTVWPGQLLLLQGKSGSSQQESTLLAWATRLKVGFVFNRICTHSASSQVLPVRHLKLRI